MLAARATGKTDDMAQLHLANGYFKPGFETTHFGAIAMQAQRCMTYYEGGLKRPIFWPEGVTTAGLVGGGKASRWANGGYLEILPATEAQTQGGHPHLTSLDELEQGKAQPRENAKSMAEEYTDPLTGEERVGQYIELSTRVTGLGLMQRAIDEAEERGTPVYTWCVLESMRPCDGVGRNNLCDVEACEISRWCYGSTEEERAGNIDRYDDPVPHDNCDDIPEGVPEKHGRAVHADGWRSYRQIITVYNRVGADTWQAQHLCRRPEAKALIYSPFTAANVTDLADYIPGAGPIWVSYDWGFTEPSHLVLYQLRDGDRPDGTRGLALYAFNEIVAVQTGERELVRALIRIVTDLTAQDEDGNEIGYVGPTYSEWEEIWKTQNWPRPWPDVWPETIVGDPSAVQMRSEFSTHGSAAQPPSVVAHVVTTGQGVLRGLISAGGGRRLYAHPRCSQLIRGFNNLRAKENVDGSFTEKPDPDPANHAFSHGPDSARYLAWFARFRFGLDAAGDVDTDGAGG